MKIELLEQLIIDSVEESFTTFDKMRNSFNDGVTKNGERNIMRNEISTLSKLYCSCNY